MGNCATKNNSYERFHAVEISAPNSMLSLNQPTYIPRGDTFTMTEEGKITFESRPEYPQKVVEFEKQNTHEPINGMVIENHDYYQPGIGAMELQSQNELLRRQIELLSQQNLNLSIERQQANSAAKEQETIIKNFLEQAKQQSRQLLQQQSHQLLQTPLQIPSIYNYFENNAWYQCHYCVDNAINFARQNNDNIARYSFNNCHYELNLNTMLQINTNTKVTRRIKTKQEQVSFCQTDKEWVPYDNNTNRFVIDCLIKKTKINVLVNGTMYTIDGQNKIQINTSTGKRRSVEIF